MLKARAKENEGDVNSAIRLYSDALDDNPKAARAHLDLALLLHDYKNDYVRAVYHYGRYLELRPRTEKKEMIKDRLRVAEQLFAASVSRLHGNEADRIADLESENLELRSELRRLRSKLPAGSSDRRSPVSDRPVRDYHRVKHGDTLTSIAGELYGDPERWEDIYKANRESLPDSNNLKVGQVLVIP